MTQAILMLSQLVLLPIQIRSWGQAETAGWYSALALATVTYFVDCGLRTAGHAELTRANAHPSESFSDRLHFCQIWSWIRVLVLVFSVVLIAVDLVASAVWAPGGYPAWHAVLILACSTETLLVIRIMYLDSLGRYRGAEASYFGYASLRLLFSIPAILVFHCKAPGLAVIYLFTAVAALVAQGEWLCRASPLLRLDRNFCALSWRVLALSRHTVAEPIANWVRLSLPVLLIRHMAPSMAVTTYVGLRAVFGAGRTSIQQLARVASVEVLKARAQKQLERAAALLDVFILLAVFFGSGIGLFVVIDNLRILGLWLKSFDLLLFQQVALAFALTAPFFSYQILMNLMFRSGDLAAVAWRHYAFVAYSLLFGVIALLCHSLPLYLGFLVAAEILLSITFFVSGKAQRALAEGRAGMAAIRLAALTSTAIILFWFMAHHNMEGWFVGSAPWQVMTSAFLFLFSMSAIGCVVYVGHRSELRLLRRPSEVSAS